MPANLRAYVTVLNEIKLRHRKLSSEVLKGKNLLSNAFVHDLSWVQIRLMCELLAIALVLVHEETPNTRSKAIMDAWQADFILRKLKKLHPDYFPQPLVESPDPLKPGAVGMADREHDCTTLPELIKLYTVSGDHLHRGSMSDILAGKKSDKFNPTTVTTPLSRFANLLSIHTIQPMHSDNIYLVRMSGPDDGAIDVTRYSLTTDDDPNPSLVRRRRRRAQE
jgi:hypothetical protein